MVDTRKRIIDAAKELFQEDGFDSATTKEIAAKAGVSEVTLFRHFETKRNLFEQTVHECMHPYKLEEYLENDVTYDLETDIKTIAQNMLGTFQKNLPLLRMVYKDRMKDTESKMHLRQHDHSIREKMEGYFIKMHEIGRLKADPVMSMKFFFNNLVGFLMKNTFSLRMETFDKEYFDWMIDKVIFAINN